MADAEDERRARNARRWRLRSPSGRAALLEELEKREPTLHAELVALRAASPQAYRKRLVAEAIRLALYEPKAFQDRT